MIGCGRDAISARPLPFGVGSSELTFAIFREHNLLVKNLYYAGTMDFFAQKLVYSNFL